MKFYGAVGFVEMQEVRPGVRKQVPVEHNYSGDVYRRSIRYAGDGVNDNITPSQQISILADPYARNHVASMKYVKWMGTPWKISEISVEYPRLILTLGGAYNGATV